ncbi:MAG: hypothetical protein ABIJ10_02460 [Candidatus Micrarchaeota archaeon]|nr:hypothetical protein [Candidatus Micrarchaeota archaeon]
MEENLNFPNNPEDIEGYKDSYIYYVRYFCNHILYLTEIVSNILISQNVDKLFFCRPDLRDSSGHFINSRERYLAEICERTAKKYGVEIFSIPFTLENQYSPKLKTNHHAGVRPPPKNHNKLLLVSSCAYGLDRVIKKIKSDIPDVIAVYVHEGKLEFYHKLYYRLAKGIDEFINLDSVVAELQYSNITDDLDSILAFLRKNKNLFEYRSLNFFDLLESKIIYGTNLSIIQLVDKSTRLSHIIKLQKPELTLSYASKNLTYVLGEICRINNLEALCISHGTVVPPYNKIDEIVNYNIGTAVILNRYPSVAVQTPSAEKFLNHYEHISNDIITGPLLFRNDIKRKKTSKLKILVHAVTLKTRFSTKFWGVETNDEFVSSIRDLISSVENAGNSHLIIHLHPVWKHLFKKGELEVLLPKSHCYTIVYSASIYNSLSKADFLVSFSSTTIEEAVINEIPVILFDKWDRYKHFDAIEMHKNTFRPYPVYYINGDNILGDCLSKILTKTDAKYIPSSDWSKYHYGKEAENGFFNYLHQCFRTGGNK